MSEGGGPGRAEPRKAPVLVLSGPSAVGKSTIVRCLRERIPDLHFSVSVTTRAPRPGEVDGVDYSFISAEQFQALIDDGALLEWAEIHGGLHRSGTPAQPIRDATSAGPPINGIVRSLPAYTATNLLILAKEIEAELERRLAQPHPSASEGEVPSGRTA